MTQRPRWFKTRSANKNELTQYTESLSGRLPEHWRTHCRRSECPAAKLPLNFSLKEELPATLQKTRKHGTHQTGKGKSSTQECLGWGYVSCQEGKLTEFISSMYEQLAAIDLLDHTCEFSILFAIKCVVAWHVPAKNRKSEIIHGQATRMSTYQLELRWCNQPSANG